MIFNRNKKNPNNHPGSTTVGNIIRKITRPHEIKSFMPHSYEAVTDISDHLLRNQTAIVDLKSIDPAKFYRAIDFLSGVAYAIRGKIEKVGDKIYLMTPRSVEVSAELKKTLSIGLENLDESE